MPRAARPRIADLTRAIKAFARAGVTVGADIKPDGTISIYPLAAPAPVSDSADAFAAWEAKSNARHDAKHQRG